MTRAEAIGIIRSYLSEQPVEWVGVFGSFARDEMRADSDIDIAIYFQPDARVSLFDYIRYKQDLEELLGRKVDLVSYKYLRPRLKAYVDEDLEVIYPAA